MGLLRLLLLLCLIAGAPAHAQTFPQLTGRVIDNANLLDPQQEAGLTQRLAAVEQTTSRQLIVATVADLQGYPIEDYGYRLGRAWGIGQEKLNNGVILLVAPNERKVRIEVGYGLEPIITDALSGLIIRNEILPRFRANDYPGGIEAGANALIQQLQAPPEAAERRVIEASQARQQAQRGSGGGGSIFPLLFWGFIFLFVILPMFGRGRRGRRYRRRGGLPIVIWGPGFGGGGGWGSGGGSWGGGGGGGFGGFSGGGGSFGGGGASGSW